MLLLPALLLLLLLLVLIAVCVKPLAPSQDNALGAS